MGRVLRYLGERDRCPECGGKEFNICMLDTIYEHPLFVKQRLVFDGGYVVEKASEAPAKYCTKCGLIVGGMEDYRKEFSWTQQDIYNYFLTDKLTSTHTYYNSIVRKKINRIRTQLPNDKFAKLCRMPFSRVVKVLQEVMIRMEDNNDDWKEVI